jgi:hypothetical protein
LRGPHRIGEGPNGEERPAARRPGAAGCLGHALRNRRDYFLNWHSESPERSSVACGRCRAGELDSSFLLRARRGKATGGVCVRCAASRSLCNPFGVPCCSYRTGELDSFFRRAAEAVTATDRRHGSARHRAADSPERRETRTVRRPALGISLLSLMGPHVVPGVVPGVVGGRRYRRRVVARCAAGGGLGLCNPLVLRPLEAVL